MSVSPEERGMRRRLVYNAMPNNTSIDVVNQAIAILENEFGDEPKIKYSDLVKRLGQAIGTNMKFGPVLGRIMIMRRKTADEIGPDPGVADPSSVASSEKPQDIVFNAVFSSIAQQITNCGEITRAEFTKWLSTDASSWDISVQCVLAINR